jgi:hypothetical protein
MHITISRMIISKCYEIYIYIYPSSMAQIGIDPHTSACIRSNNLLDLSFFLVKGVLIIIPNKQPSQVLYDS